MFVWIPHSLHTRANLCRSNFILFDFSLSYLSFIPNILHHDPLVFCSLAAPSLYSHSYSCLSVELAASSSALRKRRREKTDFQTVFVIKFQMSCHSENFSLSEKKNYWQLILVSKDFIAKKGRKKRVKKNLAPKIVFWHPVVPATPLHCLLLLKLLPVSSSTFSFFLH